VAQATGLRRDEQPSNSAMACSSEFWDALAPHHAGIENNYLDLRSVRRIVPQIRQPVLVVGAGQGLIVAELHRQRFQGEGVDLSSEMIKYAKVRRDITLVHANARALPFPERKYATIIYATGVIDFIGDELEIASILKEGRRILMDSGKMFVAFYRVSAAIEEFLGKAGLLTGNVIAQRETLRLYLLNPAQMVGFLTNRMRVGWFRAFALFLRISALSTSQEKLMSLKMRNIFRKLDDPHALINASPETQPYRDAVEIRNLFNRLNVPVKQFNGFPSCYVVQVQ